MTDDDKALVEAMKDAVLHGAGFLKNGRHVPIDDVYLDPRDARIEALIAENERLQTQYDEMGNAMLNHIGKAAAGIVRLELENERLREAMENAVQEIDEGWSLNARDILEAVLGEDK